MRPLMRERERERDDNLGVGTREWETGWWEARYKPQCDKFGGGEVVTVMKGIERVKRERVSQIGGWRHRRQLVRSN